ncbi:MAG TPA: NADP-dependent isocitrate dehydrogenase [Lactobacillus sp.]|nr:NADP-dependent isocitrate dehydrogenase [Lactobacillus sp.]
MSELIGMKNNRLMVPEHPEIPYLQGDGIGPEIWQAAQPVLDAAVRRAYQGRCEIDWLPLLAGERAHELVGEWLPQQTIMELKRHLVAIKGPMTTPVGTGHRSINVALRQTLDLYACWRPVRYFKGAPSPVKHPERVCMDVFRENTEDIYAGIEAAAQSSAAQSLKKWLQETSQLNRVRFPNTAAFGIKPISKEGSQRLVQSAVDYALKNHRHYLTLVHKGNIMKETEGGFKKWGYQLIDQKYAKRALTMPRLDKIKKEQGEAVAQQFLQQAQTQGMLVVNDIICDNFFQQALLFPEHFDVVATMNLNGDYLSDALAAQVGGLGIAPGSNINFQTGCAIFEATHGTAPQLTGKGLANPTSLILSGAMMMEYLGWRQAAELIRKAVAQAIAMQKATPDLAPNATALSTSEYGQLLVKLINS